MTRTVKRLALILFVLAAAARPALADLTMKMTMTTAAGPMSIEVPMTAYIKGGRMRTDLQVAGRQASVVADVAAKSVLMYDHATKEVTELRSGAGQLPMEFGQASVTIQPTGETKLLLDRECAGHAVTMSLPATMNGETVVIKMTGTVWAAGGGPGVDEYRAFYRSSLAAGVSAMPGMQGPADKAFAEMFRSMLETGMPIEQDLRIAFEGAGQMAQAMSQMQMMLTVKTTSIATGAIADEIFAAPAGYTKK